MTMARPPRPQPAEPLRIGLTDRLSMSRPDPASYAAVCQAVLDHRPEYVEEFAAPNAPTLD